jgi:hypothetical protein
MRWSKRPKPSAELEEMFRQELEKHQASRERELAKAIRQASQDPLKASVENRYSDSHLLCVTRGRVSQCVTLPLQSA